MVELLLDLRDVEEPKPTAKQLRTLLHMETRGILSAGWFEETACSFDLACKVIKERWELLRWSGMQQALRAQGKKKRQAGEKENSWFFGMDFEKMKEDEDFLKALGVWCDY